MANALLAAGPPPLTEEAADSAIDVFDFMAAAVRGIDLIDVTPAIREAWRTYLAAYYPMLNPVDRYWFATAPSTLAAIRAGWPQLPEVQRNMYRQAWAMTLPALSQFIEPVFRAAAPTPAAEPPMGGPQSPVPAPPETGSVGELVNTVVDQQRRSEEEAAQLSPELAVQQKLMNERMNIQMLSNWSTIATNNTIDLMRAYNRMS